MGKFAEMIYELERYMKTLSRTAMDLQNSRRQTIELNELAHKDALTGIRNKLGYDKEVQKIEWEIADGLKEFGVAMIDLNFLKRRLIRQPRENYLTDYIVKPRVAIWRTMSAMNKSASVHESARNARFENFNLIKRIAGITP